MLIAKMTNGAVVIGLSRENIKRLTNGQQIRIAPDTHPGAPLPPGAPAMFIMFGETEASCLEQLKAAGVVFHDETKRHDIPEH